MHHIVSDGWSLGVLLRELSALYGAYREGRPSPLPEPPLQYAAYARWQRERLRGAELERQLAYWRERLAGAPALLELPTDHPRPAVETHRGASASAELPGELAERLWAMGRAQGVTPFMVLLAAFQLLLAKYAGVEDVVVGTPVAGRMRVDVEELIGFFANTLVVRADLRGDLSFGELLRRVRAATLGAYDHQDLPFEKLVAELRPERSLGHSPVFQVMFSVDADVPPELHLPGIAVAPVPVERTFARLDLSLLVAKGADAWSMRAQYRADLFEPETIARMLGHLRRVLEQVAADPGVRLSAVELAGPEERRRVLEEWNPAAVERGADRYIHDLVDEQAARTPGAVAVVFGDASLTWRELVERANRLAHHLARRGAGPEARVGICLERSVDTVVALLGVLNAGAAYLPLDPRDPAERLAETVADAGVEVIVSQASLRGRLPDRARVVALDADDAEIAAEPATAPASSVSPENAAYVLYTSGSTGRPKGVVVTHANVASLFAAMDAGLGMEPGTWLAVTRTSFDLHVVELLWTLARGFRVVVQPEMERAGPDESIARQLRRHDVTHLQCTPSLAAMLVAESGVEALAGLKCLLLGGETLPPELAAAIAAVLPGGLTNFYGPTETTVWCTSHVVGESIDGAVPIGRPFVNTRAYVLDAALRPLPGGVPGELYIGGACVARGYLGRPTFTAERFVPDPFAARPGARMYRTGDRARWKETASAEVRECGSALDSARNPRTSALPHFRTGVPALPHSRTGVLEFLGRTDAQVKIRGFRIEPGEVEAALRRHAGSACAVVAYGDAPGEARLVAYVAGTGDADALRARLRESLPEHLVPAAFVFVDRLPLTPNGKLDRAALPAPEAAPAARIVPPRGHMEARVAEAWREVLGREEIGVRDGFFDLGGTSLLLHRVFVRLREIRGDLRMVDLFRHPTVESLARHLADGAAAESPVETQPSSAEEGAPAGIAVVGMSCRFPGARDPDGFWRNLRGGVESISFFTEDELLAAGVPPEQFRDPAYVRASGSLTDAYAFDAEFFGVSPRDAEGMDPQHRVFLECAWSALEDAGVDPSRFPGAIGVYAGSGTTGHMARVMAQGGPGGLHTAAMGNAKDFLTTRASHRLGLRGPAVTVQTACSTSLVAIHLACRSLRGGECDLALAGGVTIAPDQVTGYLHQAGGIASPDGHCRAFDARAAGTVFGSGAGMVALKRLADALRDGDAIRAVVRGSAVNNDGGETVGFTAPSVSGQARVIAAALADAGVDPSSVSYVEAHGTGTPLGDPIEVAALAEAFGAATGRMALCTLGSVKTNLGHLDTAAGVAGFIKTVLALQHRELPPTLHFRAPHPETGLAGSPFHVNAELRAWASPGGPRRAGVSSFGFGGTNAHVVLEEAPTSGDRGQGTGDSLPLTSASTRRHTVEGAHLLVLSARSPGALERAWRELADHLARHPELALADVAQTLREGRAAHPFRWAAACRDLAGARQALESRSVATCPAAERPPVAFLFPGQGAQHAGMARALCRAQPLFRREIDRCAELLAERGMDLRAVLFPAEGSETDADALLRQTRHAQPALFAVEYALARLWMAWGVRPDAMLGHSLGEYVAACVAGVFSLEDALRLVDARGRLMQALAPGAMLAVPLPEAEARALLGGRLSLAAVNGPAHCVVSGDMAEVQALEAGLAGRGVASRRLRTSHAFHSAAMDPVLAAFAAEVRAAHPAPPAIPFLSNVTGDWITAAQATDPAYWARHLRETVRFADGVGRLLDDPGRVLLEVGPGDRLGAFARSHGSGAGRTVLSSLPAMGEPDASDLTVLEAMGSLWTAGVDVDWTAMRGDAPRRRVPLPTYPFERTVYRVPPPRASPAPPSPPSPTLLADPPIIAAHATAGNGAHPPAARAPGTAARVAGLFAGLVGRDAARLDPAHTFLEMGADSLLLMQMSRSLETEFGVTVPFRRLLDGLATVGTLSAHLDREAPAGAFAPAEAVDGAGSAPALRQSAPPLPVADPPALPDASGLQSIIERQLALMERQVELLRAALVPGAVDRAAPQATGRSDDGDSRVARPGAEPPVSHGPHRPVSLTLGDGAALDDRQQRQFEAFVRRYTARTRRSKEYAAHSRPVLADNRASLNFRMATKELLYPIVGERSEGARLWDVDGNEYVDFTMGFGVHLFGHRPAFVMEAVDEQLRRGIHLGPQSDLAGPAAELFRELTGKERVTFCNTGSEAVMTALRIARTVTGRRRIVIFAGSYHGCFDGVLARAGEGTHVLPITPGTPPGMIEDVVVLPYGVPAAMEYLRANAGSIAAVLVEAVQSRDPELHPREFLHELRALTRRAGVVLVFDEMITGFRLHPAGAQGWYGIDADLATYGKVVGGGFPIGVVAGRAALMDAIDGGAWSYGDDSYPAAGQTFFAGTFCKHPVAMAAACAVLRHLRDAGPALYEALNARAARLVAALRAVLAEARVPMRIAHCASIFHFRPEPGFRFADLLLHHLVERGVYVWEGRACYLSTAHSEADCDRLVAALQESVHALREGGFLPDAAGPAGEMEGSRARQVSPAAAVPAEAERFDPLEPSPAIRLRAFPLTAAQRAIWARTHPGGDESRAWHEQVVIGLRGRLEVEVLRAALDDLARHHDALRTVFDPSGQEQRILSAVPVPLVVGDTSGVDDGALFRAMEDALRGELDLERRPLFRLHVHPRGPDRQVLQLVVHHLVADGVSLGILKRDLEIACRARQAGHAPRLPDAMQFSEYAARLAARPGPSAEREAEWLAGFEGAVPLVLPRDVQEPGLRQGAREVRTLGIALAARLREASRREGRTLFMTLLGGMLTLLHRLTGQDDLVIGISSAGRPFPGSASVVGSCAEVLPVRIRIRPPASLREVMESVRDRVLDAGEHESLSWPRLHEAFSLPAAPSFVFNLEPPDPAAEAPTFAGLPVERVAVPAPYTKYDAAVDVVDHRGELHLLCTFDRARFERATISRMLADFERVLEQVAEGSASAREPVGAGVG